VFMLEKEEVKNSEKLKAEKEKHNALLAGVIFFMALIIMLWLVNTASIFTNSFLFARHNADLDKFTRELQTTFSEVKIKIDTLKQISPEDLEKAKNDFQALGEFSTTSAATIKK
jgi:hypothetical protein